MSNLLMVRHGQARFGTENYDRLSDMGVEQCQRLGQYFLHYGYAFDRVFVGPLERQKNSAILVKEVYEQASAPFPELEMLPGLNEFHWDDLFHLATTELTGQFELLQRLKEDYEMAEDPARKQRNFQLIFEEVTKLWVNEAFVSPKVEPWQHFSERVHHALEHMIEGQPEGSRYLAISSGGPMAVIAQKALDLHAERAVELMWSLRNASMIEYFFTEKRFSMGAFNTHPHLNNDTMWTYR